VTEDGQVDHGWGHAERVALAQVDDQGDIVAWQVVGVGWGELHDQGTHGAHHARIVRFLKDNCVDAVAVNHMGPGMQRVMNSMHLPTVMGADGDARQAVSDAVALIRSAPPQSAVAGPVREPETTP
jgi:predicted Fe-Mo cluster-binding NifX family protein